MITVPRLCVYAVAMAVAGCGGGAEDEIADDASVGDVSPADAAAIVRSVRLKGGLVEKTEGTRSFQGCQPARFSGRAEAIVNITVRGNLLRAGRYTAHVQSFSEHYQYRQEGALCQKPDGTSYSTNGYSYSGRQGYAGRDVLLVSDGRNVEVRGALFPDAPECTGENVLTGEVIGLANPMLTLLGVTRCNYPMFRVTTRTSIKLIGAP